MEEAAAAAKYAADNAALEAKAAMDAAVAAAKYEADRRAAMTAD